MIRDNISYHVEVQRTDEFDRGIEPFEWSDELCHISVWRRDNATDTERPIYVVNSDDIHQWLSRDVSVRTTEPSELSKAFVEIVTNVYTGEYDEQAYREQFEKLSDPEAVFFNALVTDTVDDTTVPEVNELIEWCLRRVEDRDE